VKDFPQPLTSCFSQFEVLRRGSAETGNIASYVSTASAGPNGFLVVQLLVGQNLHPRLEFGEAKCLIH
jgi:hypothetical protein